MATQLTRATIDDGLTTILSAAAATGAGSAYSAKGWGSVVFAVTGSSPVGTVTFQGTADGTNWVSLEAYNYATGAVGTTTTAVGVFTATCAGLEQVRVNVTAYTSGTITVAVRGAPTADAAALLSGATATVVGADTPADAHANPTANVPVTAFNEVWNGATCDRAPGTAAGGAKVLQGTAAANTGAWPVVQQTGTTNTRTSVNGSASSVTVLALNTGRRGAVFYNDSSAILYLDLSGGTASSSNYSVQIAAQGYFELPVPIYTGLITGIWSAATGAVKVTELAA